MFSEQSSAEIQQAFERAGSIGPAGIGELETDVLTGMCTQLAGGDDKTLWKRNLAEELVDTDGTAVRFVNGRCFSLRTYSIDVSGDTRFLAVSNGNWKWEDWITASTEGISDSEGLQTLVSDALQMMEDFDCCHLCGKFVKPNKIYCAPCLTHYNSKGCAICGKRVGELTGGIHEHCAAQRR